MDDLESRLLLIENRIENLLIMHARDKHQPFTDEECKVIESAQNAMGYRGARIVRDRVALALVSEKHEQLKRELKEIEEDYPQLREKNT
jgi:hypothetical protein